tara:strand:+ start:559 stop:1080 length:522 start_codon:yes stop_codon:yes gene_type:complete
MSELRTNRIIPRDGLSTDSWGGGIIQMSYASYDGSALAITSNTDVLSGTITPKSASSKILIDVRLRAQLDGSNGQFYAGVKRSIGGATAVWVSGKGDLSPHDNGRYAWHFMSSDYRHGGCFQFARDTPATTSQCTYTLSVGPWGSASGSVRINRQSGDQETQGAQMVIYEISG